MDYRLIKENFDKATAELEDTGTLAQQGEPAFAVGDRVTFSSAYTGRRMRRMGGALTHVGADVPATVGLRIYRCVG